jgi:hypothetical protein
MEMLTNYARPSGFAFLCDMSFGDNSSPRGLLSRGNATRATKVLTTVPPLGKGGSGPQEDTHSNASLLFP